MYSVPLLYISRSLKSAGECERCRLISSVDGVYLSKWSISDRLDLGADTTVDVTNTARLTGRIGRGVGELGTRRTSVPGVRRCNMSTGSRGGLYRELHTMWGKGDEVVDGRVLDKAVTEAIPIRGNVGVGLKYAILIEDIVGVSTLVADPAGVGLEYRQGTLGADRHIAEHRRTFFPRQGADKSGRSIAVILGK